MGERERGRQRGRARVRAGARAGAGAGKGKRNRETKKAQAILFPNHLGQSTKIRELYSTVQERAV